VFEGLGRGISHPEERQLLQAEKMHFAIVSNDAAHTENLLLKGLPLDGDALVVGIITM
jgi:hypothetical protein